MWGMFDRLDFFNMIVSNSLKASILVALILLIKLLFKDYLGARVQYLLWFVVVIRLIMPWAPESAFSVYNLFYADKSKLTTLVNQTPPVEFSQEESTFVEAAGPKIPDLNYYSSSNPSSNPTSNPISNPTYNPSSNPTPNPSFNQSPASSNGNLNSTPNEGLVSINTSGPSTVWSDYNVWFDLWLFGAFLFAGLTLYRNWAFSHNLNAKLLADEGILSSLQGIKVKLQVKREIPLLQTPAVTSPSLFGLFRPMLLMPENVQEKLSLDQLAYVFAHELCHYKRKDVLINWIINVLVILHWFNPIIWYAAYKMREDQEVACDAHALSYIGNDKSNDYGYTLISLLESYTKTRRITGLASLSGSKSQLKRRVTMLKMLEKASVKWTLLGLAVVIAISFVALTNAKATENPAPSSNADNTTEKQSAAMVSLTEGKEIKKTEDKTLASEYTKDDELSLSVGGNIVKYNNLVVYSMIGAGRIYLTDLASNTTKKLSDDNPTRLYFDGKWIYYSLNKGQKGIYRLSLEGARQKISEDETLQICIYDNRIFYTKQIGFDQINGTPQGELYTMNMDGSNRTKLLKGSIKNYFKLNGEWIYYVRLDDRSLNKARLDGSQVTQLARGRVFIQDVSDKNIYYSDYNAGEALHKFSLATGKNEIYGRLGRYLKYDGQMYVQAQLSNQGEVNPLVLLDEDKDQLSTVFSLKDFGFDRVIAVNDYWVYLEQSSRGVYRLNIKNFTKETFRVPNNYEALTVYGGYAFYLDGYPESKNDYYVHWISLNEPNLITEPEKSIPNRYVYIPDTIGSIPMPDRSKSNSPIIAKVGSINITEDQLSYCAALRKRTYETMNKPQTDEFYEKVALGLLVKNALIDNAVQKHGGISVSSQEAYEFLNERVKQLQSLPDNSQAKIQFLADVKASGFSNLTEYVNSPEVIDETKKLLARSKLKQFVNVMSSARPDPNDPNSIWQNYTDRLLDAKEYEIFVPIDITGFQELERAALQ